MGSSAQLYVRFLVDILVLQNTFDSRFRSSNALSFDAMDSFMSHICAQLSKSGSVAVEVFPPHARVLVLFTDRLLTDVVGEYVSGVLLRGRELDAEHLRLGELEGRDDVVEGVYLKACAASFMMVWRIVGAFVTTAKGKNGEFVATQAEVEETM